MPKVISYTPPWLSRPSPGASLFSSTASKGLDKSSQSLRQNDDYTGPTRVLAQRGNEVFTVVDNQIRWSSLTRLKDEWQQEKRSTNGSAGQNGSSTQDGSYRVWTIVLRNLYCGKFTWLTLHLLRSWLSRYMSESVNSFLLRTAHFWPLSRTIQSSSQFFLTLRTYRQPTSLPFESKPTSWALQRM